MSTFAKGNFAAGNYRNFRPVYPRKFYDFISSQFATKPALALDLGSGTGQATVELAKIADTVIGIDNSKTMVDTANQSPHPKNVSFRVGNDDTFAEEFSPDSIDLITVAEAAHWFNLPVFYRRAHELLKKNGMLIIWGYCDQSVKGYPEISEIIDKYSYDDRYMGKFWDKGRDKLKEFYNNDKIPADLFRDTEYHFNSSAEFNKDEKLEISKDMTLSDLQDYFGTYSAYHNWAESNPELAKTNDLIDEMFKEIIKTTGLSMDSTVSVKWNTVYLLGRK